MKNNEKAERFYSEWWNKEKVVNKWLIDKDGILEDGASEGGVLEICYHNLESNKSIPAYICESSNRKVAALRVIKRFFGNPEYFTYWSGLEEDDNDKGWQIAIKSLAVEESKNEREKQKRFYIENEKPFLQNDHQGDFDLYNPNRLDSCITPWHNQRRRAFLSRTQTDGE